MFLGTTTAPFRNFLGSEFQKLEITRYIEPCAGNFVMGQIVAKLFPEAHIFTSDINEYSVLIGSALIGKKYPVKPTELLKQEFPALARKRSPLAIGACAMLLAEAGVAYRKRDIAYYASVYRQTKARAEDIHKRLSAKIERVKEGLRSFEFRAQDAARTIDEAAVGDVMFYDPPYEVGSYDAMFEAMRLWYEYPEIPFTPLSLETIDGHLKEMEKRGVRMFYRTIAEREIPGYKQVFRYREQLAAQPDSMIYSNVEVGARLVRRPRMVENSDRIEMMNQDTTLGPKSRVSIREIPLGAANHYRLLWTKKAIPQSTGIPYAMMVDGLLAGMCVLMSGAGFTKSTYAVIASDVCNLGTKYKRLSKLVLCAILTDEVLAMINRKHLFLHKGFTTAVYSNASVSMKYRGLMSRVSISKTDGPYANRLIYRCEKPKFRNLKEAYHHWYVKYGSETWTPE